MFGVGVGMDIAQVHVSRWRGQRENTGIAALDI
jgi:hypothetical protein